MEVLNRAIVDFASQYGTLSFSNTDHAASGLDSFPPSGLLAPKATENDEKQGSSHDHEPDNEKQFCDGP